MEDNLETKTSLDVSANDMHNFSTLNQSILNMILEDVNTYAESKDMTNAKQNNKKT